MNAQQAEEIDESRIKLPRWDPNGQEARSVARAVNNGTLNEDIVSYQEFLRQNQTIVHKFGAHNLKKGKRNLRSNILSVIKKVKSYNLNRFNSKTGNPIEFSKAFLRDGGFPDRPDIVADIPQELLEQNDEREHPFVPGREENFEQAVIEERGKTIFDFENASTDSEYSVESEKEDYDDLSLDFVNTNDITNPYQPIKERVYYTPPDPEQQQKKMPPKPKQQQQPAGRTPVRTQDVASWAVLCPKINHHPVNDPEYTAYGQTHTRTCLMVRTLIPQEMNPTSYRARVKQNGMQLEYTMTKISSAFDAKHTVGGELDDCDDGNLITGCFEQCLTEDFSSAITVNEGNNVVEMIRYTVNLPFEVEPRARNPFQTWNYCPPGTGGTVNICQATRATYYYGFFFKVEDPDVVNPLATLGGLLNVNNQVNPSPMGIYEMQKAGMDTLNAFHAAANPATIPRSVGGHGHGGGHGGGGGTSYHSSRSVNSDMSIDSCLKSDGSHYTESKRPAARGSKKKGRTSASVASTRKTPGVATRSSSKKLSKEDRDAIAEDARRWNPLYMKTGIFADPRVSTVTVTEGASGSEFEEKTVSSNSKSRSRNRSHRTTN